MTPSRTTSHSGLARGLRPARGRRAVHRASARWRSRGCGEAADRGAGAQGGL